MSVIINLIVFILILTVIIAFHEFGHFLFAKICGVYVYEYAIGMGPKLFSKQIGETVYSIRAIPIGGFCQLAGEDLDEDDKKKKKKDRRLQNKLALIWGGASMEPVISEVEENSAAAIAGISSGDEVLTINNHKISTSDDISLYLAVADPKAGSTFKVEHDNGTYETIKVKPKKIKVDGKETYRYGIMMEQKEKKGFINAIVFTFKKTVSIFKQMYITLAYLFTGHIKLNQLSGPVNVGVINLLPIPAFDGGHILFIIIELIKGSPVKPELENKIHFVFLVLLMILMLVITFNDVWNLIR